MSKDKYLQEFCKKFGLSYPAATGERLTPGGGLDKYVVESPRNAIFSDEIKTIKVSKAGRFGNNIHQIINAICIAKGTHISNIDFSEMNLPYFGEDDYPQQNPLLSNEGEGLILKGEFIYPWTFSKYINKITEEDVEKISKTILIPWLGIDPKKINTHDQICIHIRSGDLFEDNPNKWYIQPPLAYYIKALTHLFSLYEKMPIVLLYEDLKNPVTNELIKYFDNQSFNYSAISTGSLIQDVFVILQSKYLIPGKGTFVPALAMLSMKKEAITCFNRYNNAGYEYAKCATKKLITLVDKESKYIQRNWCNSNSQRQQMVDYPIESIEVVFE